MPKLTWGKASLSRNSVPVRCFPAIGEFEFETLFEEIRCPYLTKNDTTTARSRFCKHFRHKSLNEHFKVSKQRVSFGATELVNSLIKTRDAWSLQHEVCSHELRRCKSTIQLIYKLAVSENNVPKPLTVCDAACSYGCHKLDLKLFDLLYEEVASLAFWMQVGVVLLVRKKPFLTY
uniref:Uncharacterized protein n=1 Tax=Lobelia baumannii TaxID=2041123 RepID=A0A291F5S9_9ASTR|nr:hypothetical protein Lo_bau1Pt0364 [Lobelia baumannii]ATG27487.1 hypothetical protein Lo_bau1Pt0364 [Lobelia baumannii]